MRLLPRLTWLACLALLLATLSGLLAPWWPALEMANHFRPFLLAGPLPVLALALGWRRRGLAATAGLLAALNLVLAVLPLRDAAERLPDAAPTLRVVTANLWIGNRDVERIALALEESGADVVMLQEAGHLRRALIPRLADSFPHAFCPSTACPVAILSRHVPLATNVLQAPGGRTILASIRIAPGGRELDVASVHLAYPLTPGVQRAHVGLVLDHLSARSGPLVLAGDFNLTPFSWGLNRLTRGAGLRRHLSFGASWPTHRLAPFVLIDNVLSTPDVASVRIGTGLPIGSDHLPVVADLALR